MKKIYMDYAATSPVKPEVLKAMMSYFSEKFGNPSSIHSFGQETRAAIDKAREQVAKFLHCQPEEVIFTSGGTESDNLAIKGIVEEYWKKVAGCGSELGNEKMEIGHSSTSKAQIQTSFQTQQPITLPHVITSAFEHHAVMDTCKDLERRGLVEVTYIKPNTGGIVDVEDVEKAIKPNTVLISIMYVNNEIGTVQPIRELGAVIEKENKKRKTHKSLLTAHYSQIYFHTDAVQAIEYLNCDVKYLHLDLLTLSAHKFGGPKGIGTLFVKKGTPLYHQNIGGAQEFKLRAGTENVAGIVGLGEAIKLLSNKRQVTSDKPETKSEFDQNMLHVTCYMLRDLRDYFIDSVMKKIPNVSLNGSREKRSPNNINLSFKNVEGESILLNLDLLGIAASSGSACTSGSLEPSHVLLSMGLSPERAHGSVRFTLSENTTKGEVDFVIKSLVGIIKKLRKMSPYK